jgi:GT2 family glycosyltransferase
MSIPFTAGRARNEGLSRLTALVPGVSYVQFIDGDCIVADGWLDTAASYLENTSNAAAVCGNLTELFPDASIYNRLCDIEWAGPSGDVKACGGNAMMRVRALTEAGGFNPNLIAGEEPELCLRLRRLGGRVVKLDAAMNRHDAAILHFSQWWKRTVRSGFAYAEGAWLHGRGPERHWVRETFSIWVWGFLFPIFVFGLAAAFGASCLLFLAAYAVQALRIYRAQKSAGYCRRDSLLYAVFCVLAKFPHWCGQVLFLTRKLRGIGPRLVEYK